MKKFLVLSFLATLALTAGAQVRTKLISTIQQGTTLTYPGSTTLAIPPSSAMDTLQVSDTVAYIIPVSHLNDVGAYHQWYWAKSGSGTAAIQLAFFQSLDGLNYTPVTKGAAASAYTKTYSLSASGWSYVDFKADSASFQGRYLKVWYKTDGTASVGGKVYSITKTLVK